MKILLGILNSLCLVAVLLAGAITLPAFSSSDYQAEFAKYQVGQRIQVSDADLALVADRIVAYIKNDVDDLSIDVTVAGQRRDFFNDREKAHMADVKGLFQLAVTVRNAALLGFLATIVILILMRQSPWRVLARCYRVVVPVMLALSAGLAALVATQFDTAFIQFHHLFFHNDLWQLNPATDLLIDIMPIGFFMDMARSIATIYVVGMAVVTAAAFLYCAYDKKRNV